MIIANLHYIVPIETIDAHVVEHRALLQDLCAKGVVVCSGPKDPRTGGIIMLNVDTVDEARNVLSADPFMRENLATYEFIAFNPLKCAEGFKVFLK